MDDNLTDHPPSAEHATCRLCGGSRTRLLFRAANVHGRHILGDEMFEVRECAGCGVVYVPAEINADYYRRYYPENYYEAPPGNPLLRRLLKRLADCTFRRRLRQILRHQPGGRRLLEVGCGQGGFLSQLPASFEKHGVEVNAAACARIREHHPDIQIFCGPLEKAPWLDTGRPFDVIVLWHVFEHLSDPHVFLRAVTQVLARDGVLILEIPNRRSLGFRWGRGRWFHLDSPRHLFHYARQTMERLLAQHQLRVVEFGATPMDFFHDLAVSVYGRRKTGRALANALLAVGVIPPLLLLRWLAALWFPSIAESNSYVVRRLPSDAR